MAHSLTNVQDAERFSNYSALKKTLLEGKGFDFLSTALELFRFQAQYNPVYAQYLALLGREAKSVKSIEDIPFIPISFFKSQRVSLYREEPSEYFKSSGTGGYGPSRHAAYDLNFYDALARQCFERFYGPLPDRVILALLPAYLERSGSSLVRMADDFIRQSQQAESGFYLNNLAALSATLQKLESQERPYLLLGVSFALLDLAEQYPQRLKQGIIMETGGMKGRRKEMVRGELHQHLQSAFGVSQIHSEYGMTELFSQAYSRGQGRFESPPWMRVLPREMEDPLSLARPGKTAGLNIIDLANLDSCAFIATEDLGKVYEDGSFSVLGRFDRAEVRGCNLMVH